MSITEDELNNLRQEHAEMLEALQEEVGALKKKCTSKLV